MQAIESQLDLLRTKLEGNIDFIGQEQVELFQTHVLWSSGLLAFLFGFTFQSLRLLFGIFAIGIVVCLAVTGPSYPSFNRNPVKWLEPLDEYGLDKAVDITLEEERNSEGERGNSDRKSNESTKKSR